MCRFQDCMLPVGLLWLRLMAGLGIAYHGYGKIFGGMMPQFIEGLTGMGLPAPELFAWAAASSEFAGGILLAMGLVTQLAALFIFITMSVAAFIAHAADPLAKKELALAYWTVAGSLMLMGPGKWSIDSLLHKKEAPEGQAGGGS